MYPESYLIKSKNAARRINAVYKHLVYNPIPGVTLGSVPDSRFGMSFRLFFYDTGDNLYNVKSMTVSSCKVIETNDANCKELKSLLWSTTKKSIHPKELRPCMDIEYHPDIPDLVREITWIRDILSGAAEISASESEEKAEIEENLVALTEEMPVVVSGGMQAVVGIV